MACSTVRISSEQNGRRENGSRNYQPDENSAEEAVITAVREFDGELAQKIMTRCSCSRIWWMSTIAAFSVFAGSGFRIAVDRAERGRAATREKFLRNMSQRAADILRDDLPTVVRCVCRRWKTNRKRFCYCAPSCRNRRDGDWQRRGYLV